MLKIHSKKNNPHIFLPHLVASMEEVEETYIMVKPDGVQRGLVGEIISRFEKKGFLLKGLKLFQCPKDLAEPMSMVLPGVVGFKFSGKLRDGVTATDLVLTVTQMLRKHRVVGKFVEFYGEGMSELALADPATIANMSPEYGATMGFFPVDHVPFGPFV